MQTQRCENPPGPEPTPAPKPHQSTPRCRKEAALWKSIQSIASLSLSFPNNQTDLNYLGDSVSGWMGSIRQLEGTQKLSVPFSPLPMILSSLSCLLGWSPAC